MGVQALKDAVFRQVDPSAKAGDLSLTNKIVIALILAAVGTAIVETEPTIATGREAAFRDLEITFGVLFLAEYLARLWVADMNPLYAGSRWPRLRFIFSLSAIIDLLSIIPALLAIAGGATLALRFVRFFRILRLAKLGRFSNAWRDLAEAVRSRGEELFIAFGLAGFILLLSSTLMFLAENEAQPEKFGSIPRTMWWAIVTMTTVGYGDVYPVTPVGKFLSGLVSIAAIGLIALPTGILAAAMSDVMQRRRQRTKPD
jgi:voltage-gated potassium channel